ncbi:MAG: O-antigen polymerase [Pseudomonadota bacterium]
MLNLLKLPYRGEHYVIRFVFLILYSCSFGIIVDYWESWLIFSIVLYIILVIHFSKAFSDPLNIHSFSIILIGLYALPSTILILQGDISLDSQESLRLFSSISLGLIGYTFGAVSFKKLFSRGNRKRRQLSIKLNRLFWLTYKYRYILVFICLVVLFFRGLMPLSMSYSESVIYRMETPGVIEYFTSLIKTVFSTLTIAMISIIGDLRKFKRLSWLSYLLIIIVLLEIVGGHRGWLVALFACLLIAFKRFLKRKTYTYISIGILALLMIFLLSGGVRAARGDASITQIFNNFYTYFLNIDFSTALFWGLSDLTSPFSTFITLVKNIPQNISFEYGAYINDFSLLIPTVIYPDRPLPYNVWYVKMFEPGLFRGGGGFTFYVIGFGYLFAGPVGALFHLFLFGAFFEYLNKSFRMIGGDAGLFLYSHFFILLMSFVVGCGFAVFIKGFLMYFCIPIFLLFLFAAFLDFLRTKKRIG